MHVVRSTLTALTALTASTAAWAQEKPSDSLLTVNRYLDYETATDPRVSPDGSQLVWSRRYVDHFGPAEDRHSLKGLRPPL